MGTPEKKTSSPARPACRALFQGQRQGQDWKEMDDFYMQKTKVKKKKKLQGNEILPDNISRLQFLRVYLKFVERNVRWFCKREFKKKKHIAWKHVVFSMCVLHQNGSSAHTYYHIETYHQNHQSGNKVAPKTPRENAVYKAQKWLSFTCLRGWSNRELAIVK